VSDEDRESTGDQASPPGNGGQAAAADDAQSADKLALPSEADGEPPTTLRSRIARRFRWLRFLKPSNPGEALALIGVGVALATGGRWLWDTITEDDPWNERADQACLDRGQEYLSATGNAMQLRRQRLRIAEAALADLREIQPSVPTRSALGYGTLLHEKAHQVNLMDKQLRYALLGKPSTAIDDQLRGVNTAYEYAAVELGLAVCGQGNTRQ
jgi:hypothetical protein